MFAGYEFVNLFSLHSISCFLCQVSDIVIRWPLIAGRIPGKTAEEIEKYWKSRYSTSE